MGSSLGCQSDGGDIMHCLASAILHPIGVHAVFLLVLIHPRLRSPSWLVVMFGSCHRGDSVFKFQYSVVPQRSSVIVSARNGDHQFNCLAALSFRDCQLLSKLFTGIERLARFFKLWYMGLCTVPRRRRYLSQLFRNSPSRVAYFKLGVVWP